MMIFVSKVCARASTKPRTGHPDTEGDPEGARDGGGREGDKACCKKGRGEGVDLSGAFVCFTFPLLIVALNHDS